MSQAKPLLPPGKPRMKDKQMQMRREQDWDQRFVLGKLAEPQRNTRVIIKKAARRPPVNLGDSSSKKPNSNTPSTAQLPIQQIFEHMDFADQKLAGLMTELYELWNLAVVPEFHRQLYYEMIQQMGKIEAVDRTLKEINEFKLGKSSVQSTLKITRGREKCLMLLKQIVREAQTTMSEANIMDFVRRVSELISHLRILTLNFVEQFVIWKQSYDTGQYRYIEWVYNDWNYLVKISMDTKFIREVSIFNQFMSLAEYDDPFFLSLVGQAQRSNTDFDDHLLQHKMPKSIIRRIRKCEVVLLEEEYQLKLNQRNMRDLLQSPKQPPSNQPGLLLPPQPSQPPLSNQSSLNNFKSPQSIRPPSAFSSEQPRPPKQATRPPNLKVLLHDPSGYDLCTLPTRSLKDTIAQFKGDPAYVNSFKFNEEIALYGQEACLLYVYQQSTVSHPRLVQCSIDSGCVANRRWIVHFILALTTDLFERILTMFMRLVEQDAYDEVQVSLQHYDHDGKFQECLHFKEQLKTLKFKWKQFVNDINSRYTIYQAKRHADHPGKSITEPLVCQVARLVCSPNNHQTSEDLIIGYYCSHLGDLVTPSQVQLSLAALLSKVKFTGIRYSQTSSIEQYDKFLSSAQHPFAMPIDRSRPASVQLLNLCLRWQNFSIEHVDQAGQQYKYIRLPSVLSIFDDETVVQLRSQDETNQRSLFLVQTMDEDILFYIFEVQGPQLQLQPQIDMIFETYDQKRKYTGDLWVPAFTVETKVSALNGVNVGKNAFAGETFFSIDYVEQLKSLHCKPTHESTVFKPPFIAGFIKKDLYERISKPLYAALIEETVASAGQPALPPDVPNSIAFRIEELSSDAVVRICREASDHYRKSFNSVGLREQLLLEQEPVLLSVHERGQQLGGVTMYIDKGCVTARRWQVQTVMLKREEMFEGMLTRLVEWLYQVDQAAEEIYTYLRHYPSDEDPERLVNNKSFQESLKRAGFRWKQQTNDVATGTRLITFAHKRPARSVESSYPEPLQLKSCYVLGQPQQVNMQRSLAIVKGADMKLCDMVFSAALKCPMALTAQEDGDLFDKVQKSHWNLPATRQAMNLSREEAKGFFTQDQELLVSVPTKNGKYSCQLTNIQLRWMEAREVLVNGLKYMEFPKNENEYTIRGRNEFFERPIYLVATSDPRFTVFFVECGTNLSKINANLGFYTQAIASFTDSKETLTTDLLVPQARFAHLDTESGIVMRAELPASVPNCVFKEVSKSAVLLHRPLVMGIIHEEVVDKYNMPLVAVIIN